MGNLEELANAVHKPMFARDGKKETADIEVESIERNVWLTNKHVLPVSMQRKVKAAVRTWQNAAKKKKKNTKKK